MLFSASQEHRQGSGAWLWTYPYCFPLGTEWGVDASALLLVVLSPTVPSAICAENVEWLTALLVQRLSWLDWIVPLLYPNTISTPCSESVWDMARSLSLNLSCSFIYLWSGDSIVPVGALWCRNQESSTPWSRSPSKPLHQTMGKAVCEKTIYATAEWENILWADV